MPSAQRLSPLLGTIGQIEQSLDMFPAANEDEARLRLLIEEAVEVGYEVIYAKPICRTGTVLSFSAGQNVTQ